MNIMQMVAAFKELNEDTAKNILVEGCLKFLESSSASGFVHVC